MATSPTIISRATRKQALEERGLIRSQMRLGTGLIAFGALSIPMFQMSGVLQGQAATAAFGVATAVIGAGAAMLPTGAAASASARILRALPDLDGGPTISPAPPTADPAMARSRAGTRRARLQRARPRWAATDMARSLRQLWADEDEAQVREPDRKRRAARLHAAQAGRLRRPVVASGQHRATRHRT